MTRRRVSREGAKIAKEAEWGSGTARLGWIVGLRKAGSEEGIPVGGAPPTAGSWVPGLLSGKVLAAQRHERSPPLRPCVSALKTARATARGGAWLRGGADLFVEEFWREVRTVFPRQGVMGDVEGLEYLRITQGTEDRAFELGGEVDLAGGAVIEAEPHDVILDVSGLGYVHEHGIYSNGATEFSGSFSLASCQSSASSAWWRAYHSNTSFSARGGNFPLTTPDSISTVTSYSPYSA